MVHLVALFVWSASLSGASTFHLRRSQAQDGARGADRTGLGLVEIDSARHARQYPIEYRPALLMTFDVCNGATNQRIALVQGLAIASAMNADVVLPQLLTTYNLSVSRKVQLSELYDEESLSSSLRGVVSIINTSESQKLYGDPSGYPEKVHAYNNRWHLSDWAKTGEACRENGTVVVQFSCMFNSLNSLGDKKAIELIWKINNAITLAKPLRAIAQHMTKKIRSVSPTGAFTAMHLRIENDWVEFCPGYHALGICSLNEDRLHNVFALEHIPRESAVYIALGLTKDEFARDARFDILRRRYKVMHKEDAWPMIYSVFTLADQRDILAIIDYAICQEADFFVGNSVSTMSAMLELQRQDSNPLVPSAFHYNSGPIPLAKYMPINPDNVDRGDFHQYETMKPIKWVFSMAAGMSTRLVENMKIAVLSAMANTTLQPYCLYLTEAELDDETCSEDLDELEAWMRNHGVTVIRHRPAWAKTVRDIYRRDQGFDNSKQAKVTEKVMLALYMRFDIPIVGFTDTYVLYSEPNVLFVQDVRWEQVGHRLTSAFTTGADIKVSTQASHASGGVTFMNIEMLRTTHRKFVKWLFNEGYVAAPKLDFGSPAMSLYRDYYGEESVTVVPNASFSWRPYWETSSEESKQVSVVYLQGPHARSIKDIANHELAVDNRTVGIFDAEGAAKEDLRIRHEMREALWKGCGQHCEEWISRWDGAARCIAPGVGDETAGCTQPPRMMALQHEASVLVADDNCTLVIESAEIKIDDNARAAPSSYDDFSNAFDATTLAPTTVTATTTTQTTLSATSRTNAIAEVAHNNAASSQSQSILDVPIPVGTSGASGHDGSAPGGAATSGLPEEPDPTPDHRNGTEEAASARDPFWADRAPDGDHPVPVQAPFAGGSGQAADSGEAARGNESDAGAADANPSMTAGYFEGEAGSAGSGTIAKYFTEGAEEAAAGQAASQGIPLNSSFPNPHVADARQGTAFGEPANIGPAVDRGRAAGPGQAASLPGQAAGNADSWPASGPRAFANESGAPAGGEEAYNETPTPVFGQPIESGEPYPITREFVNRMLGSPTR